MVSKFLLLLSIVGLASFAHAGTTISQNGITVKTSCTSGMLGVLTIKDGKRSLRYYHGCNRSVSVVNGVVKVGAKGAVPVVKKPVVPSWQSLLSYWGRFGR